MYKKKYILLKYPIIVLSIKYNEEIIINNITRVA